MIDPATFLADALAIESTTGSEEEYARFVEAYLQEHFAPWLVRCERQRVEGDRFNLLACCGSQNPRLLFSTHLDTVPPYFAPRREGDRIHGRGACDTKGVLAAMLAAACRLGKSGLTDFGFLLVVGEEVDHCGAIAARDGLDLSPETVLLGEPTRNRMMLAQKGALRIRVLASGSSGHSGYPETGRSAIHTLLAPLARLLDTKFPDDPELGRTTVNIGRLEGGNAANVIADQASADIMIRTAGPIDPILQIVHESLGEQVTTQVVHRGEPERFQTLPGFETDVANYFTDAGYLKALGPVTLLGPGDIRVAHSPEEHITLEDLTRGVEIYESAAHTLLTAESPS